MLSDPLMQRGGKLFKLFKLLLCFSVEERMSWRRFWEHIIELRHVGDDRLLVRLRRVNVCKYEEIIIKMLGRMRENATSMCSASFTAMSSAPIEAPLNNSLFLI